MRALMIVSNHMEDVEALATRALLIRAGITVRTVTVTKTEEITTAFGLTFRPDGSLEDEDIRTFDAVIVPGGKYVQMIIDQDVMIQETVKAFDERKALVAAICAGPRFLGRAGILNERRFTAFPGSETDMPLGTYVPSSKVVTDGHVITARGAGAVYDFVHAIVSYLIDQKTADALLESIRY